MNIQERFESKIVRDPNSGCWLWAGNLQPKPSLPYGRFQIAKTKAAYAHRVAWQLYRGEIPKGLYVCHTCDVPYCVNPSHLWLGTYAQNNADKDSKGRGNQPRGHRHPNSKLTLPDVLLIRQLLRHGFNSREIATLFQVQKATIKDINHRRTWSWLS